MERDKEIKYLSLFTGIGGFEEGIHRAMPGAKSIGYSEIDKYACMVLKYKYPEVKNYGDCTKIKPEELEDFDVLVGGFPCQAFSIAGKRMGFEDTRGSLFFTIANIAKVKKPRVLWLENVKGLLNHEEGRTFAVILSTLAELGYDAEWQLLNSKHFGVPQNRERIVIVAYLRGKTKSFVFPIREETKGNIKMVQKPDEKFQQTAMVYSKTGISPTLTRSGCENILVGEEDRSISINEAEALQGFLKDWTKFGVDGEGNKIEMPLRERFHMCGNAVTVNVMEAVGRRVKKVLEGWDNE